MNPVSLTPPERARKMRSIVLRCLQEPGRQVAIATAMGISESGISRLKNDHLENFCQMLAHSGLKIVPTENRCFDEKTIGAVLLFAQQRMKQIKDADCLVWEDDDK